MTASTPITLREIFAAERRIAGIARRTPLVASQALSQATGGEVRLKLETLQDTGAFKLRGAANAILALDVAKRVRGVVTYSTGNHGRAVAHVAGKLGIPATICVSKLVRPAKIEALRRAGCELHIGATSQDEAGEIAGRLEAERGTPMICPINDRNVLTGQGTIGLEMIEDWPQVDDVIVPLSGGALAAGVALALKSACPDCRVIGVSMQNGAAMHASLAAGKPVLVEEVDSLADSLQGGILLDNRYSFAMVRDLVDEVVLVSEDEIARAMAWAYWREKLVVEGGAATPIAAVLADPSRFAGRRVGLVVTGNAVDLAMLLDIAVKWRAEVTEPIRDTVQESA